MREIQRRIADLKPYVMQMGFSGEYITVDATFKSKWVLLTNDKIEHTPNNDGKSHKFYALNDVTDIDEVLDFIEDIIKYNIEREDKLILLKEKADELKQLFTDKSLEELKTLKFVIEAPVVSEEEINFDELPVKKEELEVVEEEEKDMAND